MDFPQGKIVGTKRFHKDGKFKTYDGKPKFMATQWRGLQAAGKQEEKDWFAHLINNGRANHVRQSIYLDQTLGQEAAADLRTALHASAPTTARLPRPS